MKSDDEKVKCPFYSGCTNCRLNCHGIVNGSVSTKIQFINPNERKDYMNQFCKSDCWKGCVIAQAAEEIN